MLATRAIRGLPRADHAEHPGAVLSHHVNVLGGELLEFAARMAMIRLDGDIVGKMLEEVGMSDEVLEIFSRTSWGKRMTQTAWTEGVSEGRTEGRDEGRRQERMEWLNALLLDRFGKQPGLAATARRLSRWSDPGQAVHAISAAATLADLPADPPA